MVTRFAFGGAIALTLAFAQSGLAACSIPALDAAAAELRAAVAPACGVPALRHAFRRACNTAAHVATHAVVECASDRTPRTGRAHRALMRALLRVDRAGLSSACAAEFETALETLDAALTAAATGIETTTTTTPPGLPTTTTQPVCTTVSLEVDKGDCTSVTSQPRGLVRCGASCDVQTFTVPASGSLRLVGTPAPGDVGVSFGTDCDDDGTVPLASATPPDCSLSCDCSSGL